ncbi:hypothetical protein FB45DRAFT_874364 [Roridomyces roridus]|uniref:Uncharacterized protein n=1 Tax=Roridomyces roridus TaxID=1738132 RepID=A0AAD7B8I6_9AGAR|nr:hypothetical protein FB45DRAFT_874364 [Roridomyces roridus]
MSAMAYGTRRRGAMVLLAMSILLIVDSWNPGGSLAVARNSRDLGKQSVYGTDGYGPLPHTYGTATRVLDCPRYGTVHVPRIIRGSCLAVLLTALAPDAHHLCDTSGPGRRFQGHPTTRRTSSTAHRQPYRCEISWKPTLTTT